jgi:dUTP pyrophosphatase
MQQHTPATPATTTTTAPLKSLDSFVLPTSSFSSLTSLQVKRLSSTATLPTRGSELAAGYDLYASETGRIPPFSRMAIPTGISLCLPTLLPPFQVYGSMRPRSGLSVRNGINVGAGVIDADFRGEVKVVLFNHSYIPFDYKQGDRIAQLVLEVHITPPVIETDTLPDTTRGSGGFGSTGK